MAEHESTVGFGGGCHWCTEAVFASLRGISHLQQGYIRSQPPDNTFSEAVLLEYDERIIPLQVLIEIHLRTHASTSQHSMRKKYRSAIYVSELSMVARCQSMIKTLQSAFEKPLITRVLTLAEFKSSDQAYQNYYATDPARPFCITHIDPKLALLKREYAGFVLR